MNTANILVVDDDPVVRKALKRVLEMRGHSVKTCGTGSVAIEECKSGAFRIAFVDHKMPEMDGMEVIRRIKEIRPSMAIIMITAYGEISSSVEAMKLGAYHYMVKPFDNDAVLELVEDALEKFPEQSHPESDDHSHDCSIVGSCQALREVFHLIDRVARTDSTVLITGESGTGKELVARAIHARSQRARHRLVTVNCGSIPDTLMESELFGHVKGAFTGATYSRPGRFTIADKGTIFLDEIGDMSLQLQIKLLRVLQEREFEPVGNDHSMRVDVRVIAATHQDLKEAIQDRRFRQDLFYRLNVIEIHLPPLRERVDDIPLLSSHFRTLFNQCIGGAITGFSREAIEWMQGYSWPGNVREMENVVERLVILKGEGEIQLEDVRKYALDEQSKDATRHVSLSDEGICLRTAVSQFERELITQALERTRGNKNKAADLLGLNRTTLVEKIKRKYPLTGTA